MVLLFYTTLISIDLAQCKMFCATVDVFLQEWYIFFLNLCNAHLLKIPNSESITDT